MFKSLNTPIVYFEFAASAIFILMVIFIYLRRLNRTSSSRVFLILMVVCLIGSLCDIASWQFIKFYAKANFESIDKNFWLSNLLLTTSYFLRYNIIFFYLIYVIIYTKSLLNIVKKKIFYFIFLGPFVICETLIIINAFINFVYKLEIDASGNLLYTETAFLYILETISLYYCIVVILHLCKNYSTFSKTQFASLLSVSVFVIIAMILNIFFPNLLLEHFIVALGFLMIVQNVESPDLLLDSRTGLSSSKQYDLIIKRRFIYKLDTDVILLNIINYSDILHKLGYENFDSYLRHFSETLKNKFKSKNISYSTYYLGDGLYSLVFFKAIGIRDLCDQIYNELSNFIYKNIDFKSTIGLCLINVPRDFSTNNLFFGFVDNFHDNIVSGVTIYSDIKNDRDFLIKYNMESILDDAIKFNRFMVYYQPIYNVEEKKFSVAEALSRIDDPTYGIIYPNSFIYFAESNGYISTIDLHVIESVMKFLNSINILEYNLSRISINLSLADFNTIDFVDKVIALKEKYSFDPSLILFEITETNTIGDKNYYFDKIHQLKAEGFDFILDDYGVGYSNLERFAKSPIDFVKVDRELVKLSNNKTMKDVLKTTFSMIHELNRKSVIEGIETKEELDEFMKFNCNYVQGFFFSKPIPEIEFLEFLKENNK